MRKHVFLKFPETNLQNRLLLVLQFAVGVAIAIGGAAGAWGLWFFLKAIAFAIPLLLLRSRQHVRDSLRSKFFVGERPCTLSFRRVSQNAMLANSETLFH